MSTPEPTPALKATREEIAAFLAREFEQTRCMIEDVGPMRATLSHPVGPNELRPGGTVSGPTMMAVADVALYVAILGQIGIVPLTVTSSMTIHFLRKPMGDRDLLAECRLLKLGRTLAVGEVLVYSRGQPEPVAHVVGSYAIPADARR